MQEKQGLVASITINAEEIPDPSHYPFHIPAVRALVDEGELELHPQVTFLVGENGSGKSTLLEAIAVAAGFNAEGGTKNFSFSTRRSESELHRYLLVNRVRRMKAGYFLRAESYFNVATEIERLDAEGGGPPIIDSYGGRSLHEQSHGESFLALVQHRFGAGGFYILDEPEAALSPSRQLALISAMDRLARRENCQFLVATHSPILMAYPHSWIYQLEETGIRRVSLEETEHYQVTRDFLNQPDRYLRHLLEDGRDQEEQSW